MRTGWTYSLVLVLVTASVSIHAVEQPEVTTGGFEFADIEAFYQMVDSESVETPLVLFLHGENHTSDDWVELGTMQQLHGLGYRTVAVDLPGYGKTRHLPYLDNNMRAEFIKAALEFAARGGNLTEAGAVLVTPTLSGDWAIPFLDRYGIMLKGWVAVSPSGVSKWGGPWEDTHKKVKLLALYGDNDEKKSQADNLLKLFSRSSKVIIPGAGEACHLEQPENFIRHLKTFVKDCFKKTPKQDL